MCHRDTQFTKTNLLMLTTKQYSSFLCDKYLRKMCMICVTLRLDSLVHVLTCLCDPLPTLCLLHKAQGGVTKKQRRKKSKSRFEGLDSFIDGRVCVTLDHSFALLPPCVRCEFYVARSKRSPQLLGCQQILSASPTLTTFSDQLAPMDSSD